MERVLHVVTYMGRGGLETMIMNYYRHMDREQIQFDFLVHRMERADYDDEIEGLGGKIYRLPQLNPVSPSYHRALKDFFAGHPEYRIVHSHLDCMSAIPLRAAKMAGVPVRIAHAHSSNQDRDWKYLLKLYYKTRIRKYATRLFACSQAAGEWTFGTKNFTVMPNAIDVKTYTFDPQKRAAVRQEFGFENSLIIGHVGRFSPVKNQGFLVDVLFEAIKLDARAKLVLVGDGDGMQAVQEKVEQLGLGEYVRFLGVRSDISDIMQAMDVFVMPSKYEGLGIVAIEAQSAGVPCLISDKVPIECKKTELVHQIRLSDSPEVWAMRVIEMSSIMRRDTYEKIKASGFDIEDSAIWLQKFYLSQ